LALLPTNKPAPMMPPIEINATCRERSVRLSVGATGGKATIDSSLRKRAAVL
jgi:hypothetical protein